MLFLPPFLTEPCLTLNLGFRSPRSKAHGAEGAATHVRRPQYPEKGQGAIKV